MFCMQREPSFWFSAGLKPEPFGSWPGINLHQSHVTFFSLPPNLIYLFFFSWFDCAVNVLTEIRGLNVRKLCSFHIPGLSESPPTFQLPLIQHWMWPTLQNCFSFHLMLLPRRSGRCGKNHSVPVKFLLNDPEAPTEAWRQAASDGEERTVCFFVFFWPLLLIFLSGSML